jgi:hypothetical protein
MTAASKQKIELAPISNDGEFELPILAVRPSALNDRLYKPISAKDPDIQVLARSIRQFGLKEAILISLDNFIISGHRRHMACRVAGLKSIRCKREPILSTDPVFLPLLRECNRQRIKTLDEMVRRKLFPSIRWKRDAHLWSSASRRSGPGARGSLRYRERCTVRVSAKQSSPSLTRF